MTAEKKNQYEELIDQMMIDEVSGLDKDIRATLEGLSTNKKRMAILSILDKDRDMFLKIKELVKSDTVSKKHYTKHIVEMLREYVKVGEVEKKTLGEVMTPIPLVQDILNTLPKETWSNPNLKFLDPCNGVGIFSSIIVNRLMYGLVKFEPDEEKRYRHIVENQLYVGELQAKNMFLFLCAFDPQDEYALNIYNGSYLDKGFDEHMKDVWGVEKFDVIVMNPPYQLNTIGNTKTEPIWDKFVNKSFDILTEGGYFATVHPDGWRNIEGRFKKTQLLLRSKQIKYLEMHNKKDGLKTFGAATTFDFYCVQNSTSNNSITKIKTSNGVIENINISNMEFIPNGMFEMFNKLVAKPGEEKVEVLYSRSGYGTDKKHMSKEKTKEHNLPCVYTIAKNGKINIFWSSTNKNGHFNIPKVIWSNGISEPTTDKIGQYGLTQFSYAIVDKVENLEKIQKVMLNKEFIELMSFSDGMTGTGHRYNRKAISTFRKDFWKEFVK